jgi:hypothetical protein
MIEQLTDSLPARLPKLYGGQANPADSLGLQQAQLEALYEPPPVPFTFESVGWEVLGILMLVLLLVAAGFWIRWYIRNAYRREALKKLKEFQSGSWKVQDVLLVLKQSAMHAYGRRETGNLYGHEWLEFLESSGKNVHLVNLERDISAAVYKNESLSTDAGRDLLINAKNWINTHAARKS